MKKGEQELLDALNAALETLNSSGEFDTIYDSWFEGIVEIKRYFID